MYVICTWGVDIFWFVVMSLLSSWDEIDFCAKFLVDGLWEAENDKPGFLSAVVDIFDQLFF